MLFGYFSDHFPFDHAAALAVAELCLNLQVGGGDGIEWKVI